MLAQREVKFAFIYAIHDIVCRLPVIDSYAALEQSNFEVAVHFGTLFFYVDMLLFNLLLCHFLLELFRVHDHLEHEVVEVRETLRLLLFQLIYLISLLLNFGSIHFAFNVRPDILQRYHLVFDQERCQIKEALIHQCELTFKGVFVADIFC